MDVHMPASFSIRDGRIQSMPPASPRLQQYAPNTRSFAGAADAFRRWRRRRLIHTDGRVDGWIYRSVLVRRFGADVQDGAAVSRYGAAIVRRYGRGSGTRQPRGDTQP